MKKLRWKKYALEFFSIFIAVISAFALNNWNENRREARAEEKILIEIKNGLIKDIDDLKTNLQGHKNGIESCHFWRSILNNEAINKDTIQLKYIELTRDFTSLQNRSGYETLKSKGLEIIDNDTLRTELIDLYEYEYYTLKKLEEDYEEMQFQKSYFLSINTILAPHFIYDKKGNIIDIESPLKLTKKEKNSLLSFLMKIELNRKFVLHYYGLVKEKVNNAILSIEHELDN